MGIHSSDDNTATVDHFSDVQERPQALVNADGTLRFPTLSNPTPILRDDGTLDAGQDAAIAALDQRVTALQQRTAGITAEEFQSLQEGLQALQSTAAAKSVVEALRVRIASLETNHGGRLDGLDEETAGLRARIVTLEEAELPEERIAKRNALLEFYRDHNKFVEGYGWRDADDIAEWGPDTFNTPNVAGVEYNAVNGLWEYSGDARANMYSEWFPIEPFATFYLAHRYQGSGRFYVGLQYRDANNRTIRLENVCHRVNTVVPLTAPFAPGDTVLDTGNLNSWTFDNANTSQGLAFSDQGGALDGRVMVDTGARAVTPWSLNDSRVEGSGEGYSKSGDRLVFNQPVTDARLFRDGQPWPVGTWVRQPFTRGTNFYASANITMADNWNLRYNTFRWFDTGNPTQTLMIPWTARTARLLVLWNFGNDAGTTQRIKDIALNRA